MSSTFVLTRTVYHNNVNSLKPAPLTYYISVFKSTGQKCGVLNLGRSVTFEFSVGFLD